MRHRADSVREKAESAIRRIKEYRRRGDIRTGVPLKRGVSSVRMVAIEPDFDAALPWLDRDVKDDRLIAATLEIVREHPHSPVLLITRDANVENKADLADVPFLEPPDPPADPPEPPQRQEARPDIRLFDLQATGGGDRLTFAARVQNYGQRPARATFKASIDGQEVSWRPEVMDLLVNAPPTLLYIEVPRAELGDLVHEFA